MTARELAALLRTVRQTHDISALLAIVRGALLRPKNDAREILLYAIATKLVRLEQSN